MAKKAKKKASKRTKPAKKTIIVSPVLGRAIQKSFTVKKYDYDGRKLKIVIGNLLLFIILFVFSSLLYTVSTTDFYQSLFFMLSLIFGVFSIALMMVLLIFVFMRVLNNK